jgi:hypothetical protein
MIATETDIATTELVSVILVGMELGVRLDHAPMIAATSVTATTEPVIAMLGTLERIVPFERAPVNARIMENV